MNAMTCIILSTNALAYLGQIFHVVQIGQTSASMLSILALLVNTVALLVVIYQTRQSRQALDLTRDSLKLDTKVRQAELIPHVYSVGFVDLKLKDWISELRKTISSLSQAKDNDNPTLVTRLANGARTSPAGLVEKHTYENGPEWLSNILLAGAQHYYSFHGALRSLSLSVDEGQNLDWDQVGQIICIGEQTTEMLAELRSFVEWVIPSAVGEAPSSIDPKAFF